MLRLLERPGLLLSLFLATGLGVGGALVHLTTPRPTHAKREFVPAPSHMCPSGVSDWNRRYNQLEDEDED